MGEYRNARRRFGVGRECNLYGALPQKVDGALVSNERCKEAPMNTNGRPVDDRC